PLLAVVGVLLAHPAALAAAEQDLRAVGGEAREPVDGLALRDLFHVRAVGLHREEVVVADPRARPDDQARYLLADLRHGRALRVVHAVLRPLWRRAAEGRTRGKSEHQGTTQ